MDSTQDTQDSTEAVNDTLGSVQRKDLEVKE